jgi:hypothetical protein
MRTVEIEQVELNPRMIRIKLIENGSLIRAFFVDHLGQVNVMNVIQLWIRKD